MGKPVPRQTKFWPWQPLLLRLDADLDPTLTLQAFLFDYYPDQDNSGNTQSPEQPTLSLENGAKVIYAKKPASGIDAHVCPQGSCLELNYAFNQYAKVRWERLFRQSIVWL